jgi:anti-sigma factor RsiW
MNREEDTELSEAVKAMATRYPAPPGLRERIVTAVSHADSAHTAAAAPRRSFRTLRTVWQQWGSMGVAFACGVIASLAFGPFFASQGEEDLLSQEVVAGHVRSLMVAHLADVASSDQHTVKPWFSGKLDYSPPVHDLAQQGFPLQGGRLDYLDRRPVAALVYRRQQHTINLFVWPTGGDATPAVKLLSRQGYNIAEWREEGMQFWAVSDLSAGELQTFAQQFQSFRQQ